MGYRLFAALELPFEISETLLPLQSGLKGALWRPRENLHLTLRYFGAVDEQKAADLDGELASITVQPFDLQLKSVDWFGKADPKAVWAGVSADPISAARLESLQSKCERAARSTGLGPDKRNFQPHVTLAYLRDASMDSVGSYCRSHQALQTEAFQVTHFTLFSSWSRQGEANIYEALEHYPLG
jgi:2'-5' RNA ligase